MANQGDMRVSDADRDAAATRLREHFAAGRLTLEEFQDRLTAAFAATTSRELGRVTADLPSNGVPPRMNVRASGGGGRRPGQPRPGKFRPGQFRPGQARPGQPRTGQPRTGQARPGQPRTGQPRALRYGRRGRRLRSRLLLATAAITVAWLLIAYSLPHGGLLVAALLVMLGLMGLAVGVVIGLIWLGRRALRRGAWLEGLPLLVGAPWLGRLIWAGRWIWMGRAVWRARSRVRPAYPAGQERTAARSGTTR